MPSCVGKSPDAEDAKRDENYRQRDDEHFRKRKWNKICHVGEQKSYPAADVLVDKICDYIKVRGNYVEDCRDSRNNV